MFPQSQSNSTIDLASIAAEIRLRKLESPAIFLLEMHKPITTLARFSVEALTPILFPLVGARKIEALQQVLASRENVEQLITLLEAPTGASHGV